MCIEQCNNKLCNPISALAGPTQKPQPVNPNIINTPWPGWPMPTKEGDTTQTIKTTKTTITSTTITTTKTTVTTSTVQPIVILHIQTLTTLVGLDGDLIKTYIADNINDFTKDIFPENLGRVILDKSHVTLRMAADVVGAAQPYVQGMVRYPVEGDAPFSVIHELISQLELQNDDAFSITLTDADKDAGGNDKKTKYPFSFRDPYTTTSTTTTYTSTTTTTATTVTTVTTKKGETTTSVTTLTNTSTTTTATSTTITTTKMLEIYIECINFTEGLRWTESSTTTTLAARTPAVGDTANATQPPSVVNSTKTTSTEAPESTGEGGGRVRRQDNTTTAAPAPVDTPKFTFPTTTTTTTTTTIDDDVEIVVNETATAAPVADSTDAPDTPDPNKVKTTSTDAPKTTSITTTSTTTTIFLCPPITTLDTRFKHILENKFGDSPKSETRQRRNHQMKQATVNVERQVCDKTRKLVYKLRIPEAIGFTAGETFTTTDNEFTRTWLITSDAAAVQEDCVEPTTIAPVRPVEADEKQVFATKYLVFSVLGGLGLSGMILCIAKMVGAPEAVEIESEA